MISGEQFQDLKRYFAGHHAVAFALLFGSQATGRAVARSDADIAVYFTPPKRHPVEWEAPVRYEAEERIGAELERLLGRDVDHDYLDARWETLRRFLAEAPPIYRELLAQGSRYLEDSPESP